jgi:hypothetical protein
MLSFSSIGKDPRYSVEVVGSNPVWIVVTHVSKLTITLRKKETKAA